MQHDELELSDESIIEHDLALVDNGDGTRTNALMLTVLARYPDKFGPNHGQAAVEIMLTREELATALQELNEDWGAHSLIEKLS